MNKDSWQKVWKGIEGVKPVLVMVFFHTMSAIVNIGYKLAINDGMKVPILVTYRFMFGAVFILPLAFFVERKKRPKLTRKIVLQGFLSGLLGGSLAVNLFMISLALTSPTFAIAISNLVPAITFLVAIFFRIEKLRWSKTSGKAKVFGTLVGVGGAMVFTFYQGPNLKVWKTGINLLKISSSHYHDITPTKNSHAGYDVVLGLLLALASCFCYSLWLATQAKVAEEYPCPYSNTAMMNVWGAIQCTVYAICVERDWSQWTLGWNIRLISVIFSGVIGSGIMLALTMWCIKIRGPLFVAIFSPLQLMTLAIAGLLFLEEKLHLGMVIGGILIVGGLYAVLWGKEKEKKKSVQLTPENGREERKSDGFSQQTTTV